MSWQKIVRLSLLLVLMVSLSNTFVLDIATADETLNPGPHPRLFFDAEDIDKLRTKVATSHREIWLPILAFADSRIGKPARELTPDRALDFFRDSGNRLVALAFACVITDTPEHCDTAKSYLLTYSGWDQWDPRNQRGLGLAHMLQGSAIAYDWLYGHLSAGERLSVRESLAKWTRRLYEASSADRSRDDWDNWWRKSYAQNHYYIINAALGLAGLALLEAPEGTTCAITAYGNVNKRSGPGTDYEVVGTLQAGETVEVVNDTVGTDDFVWWQIVGDVWVRSDVVSAVGACGDELQLEVQTWIDQARDRLAVGRDLLNGIGDGSWHEGIPYQSYFLTMSLPFMVNLRKIQDVDVLPHIYLRNYATWHLYNHLSNNKFILAYGNAEAWWETTAVSLGPLRFVAGEYQEPYAAWVAQALAESRPDDRGVLAWYVYEFFHYDPDVEVRSPDGLVGAHTFEDIEAVIWRTGWEADDWVFALKSGPHGGRFAFDTFVQGTYPWEAPCVETGCQLNVDHNHEDTNGFYIFGGGDWVAPEGIFYEGYATKYHNTLLIDGLGQYRPPAEHYGQRPEDFVGSDGFLEAVANTPHFNYLASDATQRYEKYISGIEDITRYVVFVRPDYWLMLDSVAADAPHLYEWVAHFGDRMEFEDGWVRGRGTGEQSLGVKVLAPESFEITTGEDVYPSIHTRPTSPGERLRFIHFLFPAVDDTIWTARPEVSLLADTGAAAAVRVTTQARRDDILISYKNIGAATDAGPYRFDGRVAVVTSEADGSIQKLFVYGGSFVLDQERILVDNLDPEGSFEAIYRDSTVEISGMFGDRILLYAPGVEQLFVNGQPRSFSRADDYITIAASE